MATPFMSMHPLAQKAPTREMQEAHDADVPDGLKRDYKASLTGMRAAYELAVADLMAKLRPYIEQAASANDVARTLAIADLLRFSAPPPAPRELSTDATKGKTCGQEEKPR